MNVIFFQVILFGIFHELEKPKEKTQEIFVGYSNYKSIKNRSYF